MKKLSALQIHEFIIDALDNGYKLFGDNGIGYRAFNESGHEVNFSCCLEFSNGEFCEDNAILFTEVCSRLSHGSHSDCDWWD